jgi:hypothetical protein
MGCCGGNKVNPEEEAIRNRSDKNFKGPIGWEKRKCRDLHCCLLYGGLWFGLVIVAAFAFEKGDPYRIWYGYDSWGNTCGRSNSNISSMARLQWNESENNITASWGVNSGMDLTRQNKLLWYYAASVPDSIALCVERCPSDDYIDPDTFSFAPVPSNTGWCVNDAVGCSIREPASYATVTTAAPTTPWPCVDNSPLCIYVQSKPTTECPKTYSGTNVTDLCPATCETCNGTTTTTTTTPETTTTTTTTLTTTTITTTICDTEFNPYTYDAYQTQHTPRIDSRGCPTEVWGSLEIMNRCVPTGENVGGAVSSVMDQIDAMGVIGNIIADFETAKWSLAMLFALCILLSFIVVCCLRRIAAVIIWTVYWLLFLGTCVLLAWLWWSWTESVDSNNARRAANVTVTKSQQKNEDLFFGLAITWSVIGGLLLIFLIYIHKTIALVVAIFKEAGKVVYSMPIILLYPLKTFAECVAVVMYFLYIFFYLWSAGDPTMHVTTQHVTYEWSDELHGWLWLHLFGFYWTFEIVLAFQEAVIAGAAAEWYFTAWVDPVTKKKKAKITWPICGSMARMIRFSMGSLIAGALIIAIVKIIRFFMAFIEDKIKKAAGKNFAIKCLLRCVNCCLWCVEKCLKFLNRNAYIEVAIYGDNFCRSAQSAFAILMRNAVRVSAINSIGDAVLFLCKLVVAMAGLVGAFYWFRHSDEDLNYEAFMIIVVGLFAYYTACMFIGVFEMIIDTIFLCFCEDAERNDPTHGEGSDYFMSLDLLKFMAKSERDAQKRHDKERKLREEMAAGKKARKTPKNPNQFSGGGVTPVQNMRPAPPVTASF